ncbi:hypothetical protein M9H77_22586 [Catharanthus roseus]|uniref:Uncharacterized protein n=1 Tax=Catharanthus roseus TaxID=4058 RepID=A0ACC0AUZ9_CATRO|nr:hypothetical protein M9H77_22586 [Catharanthus roseus]
MASPPIFLASILSLTCLLPYFWSSTIVLAQSSSSEPISDFVFNGFNESIGNFTLKEAVIKQSGALRLTNNSHNVIGHAFFAKPFPMLNTTSKMVPSFSTYFVFQIVPAIDGEGGYGLAFTLSPAPQFVGGQGGHFLGVFSSSNDRLPSNHIFMVEFDTLNGYEEKIDTEWNHVGININTMDSNPSEAATYYDKNDSKAKENVDFQKGPVQAWIDYDGPNKLLNVTIAPLEFPKKPNRPLISEVIDLSVVMKEKMYAGFSAATGAEKRSAHYILGWSFRLNGISDSLDISRLPILPDDTKSSSLNPILRKALISTFSIVVFFLFVALFVLIYRRRQRRKFEGLEEWELDCPRRLSYKDLYTATKGFKLSNLIGSGGFGEVYKGKLNGTGAEIAVKKISNGSLQGIREFAAEIESLGRLRHKHLVNLQGWCKYKNDLLLVYDYVPNGSLDCFLYSSNDQKNLNWEQRFKILKGIASGLLYLHEEWEQVVIHRDVKSSNVLIDGEMNGRLGDFGLARLYDRSKNCHTTNVVGTIGYIAPELTRTGKASTSSDVFAYGVLLLEIATGKPPILYDPLKGHLPLVDWVIECFQSGKILDAIDPKLKNEFVVEEIEMVLGLGLICSHQKQEFRPSMRQVIRYLNGDDFLPAIDNNNLIGFSSSVMGSSEIGLGFSRLISGDIKTSYSSFEVISSGSTIPVSYRSSSIGEMSSSSFASGR